LLELRVLPPRVAWFYLRADLGALRTRDQFSLVSAARPRELAELIQLARGRVWIAELGTGTAWTAIALALSERTRRVITCDPIRRPERDLYLSLVPARVCDRITFVTAPGNAGASTAPPVDMVFIDSSHEREATIAEFGAWRPLLGDQGIVAFHDYEHSQYPGVAEAIRELGLEGEVKSGMFVWMAQCRRSAR
jgi:predicted O-methyltransferase YrrM